MEEGAPAVLRVVGGEYLVAAERHRKRQRSSGETLGITSDIRQGGGLLAGEHGSRPAPAGHHLVRDEQHAVGRADPPQLCEHRGRVHEHAAGAEHQRLDDECRCESPAAV